MAKLCKAAVSRYTITSSNSAVSSCYALWVGRNQQTATTSLFTQPNMFYQKPTWRAKGLS